MILQAFDPPRPADARRAAASFRKALGGLSAEDHREQVRLRSFEGGKLGAAGARGGDMSAEDHREQAEERWGLKDVPQVPSARRVHSITIFTR
jgi:hypothetical protein